MLKYAQFKPEKEEQTWQKSPGLAGLGKLGRRIPQGGGKLDANGRSVNENENKIWFPLDQVEIEDDIVVSLMREPKQTDYIKRGDNMSKKRHQNYSRKKRNSDSGGGDSETQKRSKNGVNLVRIKGNHRCPACWLRGFPACNH